MDDDDAEADQVEQEDGRHISDGGGPRIGVDFVQLLDVVWCHVLVQTQLVWWKYVRPASKSLYLRTW